MSQPAPVPMSAPVPTVAVRGTAQRSSAPDSFVLTVTVEARGPDAATVNTELAARFGQVDGALSALTAAQLELHRGQVSVHRTVIGQKEAGDPILEWFGTRGIRLSGRDVAQTAALMGTVSELAEHGDGLNIDGPHWLLDDDNAVHAAAQTDAVRAAEVRAARYAEAVGGRLGALVEIADTNAHAVFRAVTPLGFAEGAGGLGTMDFTPEPVEVTATVEGRWYIDLG